MLRGLAADEIGSAVQLFWGKHGEVRTTGEEGWNHYSRHGLSIIVIITEAIGTVFDSETYKPINKAHFFYLIGYNLRIFSSQTSLTANLFGKQVEYKSYQKQTNKKATTVLWKNWLNSYTKGRDIILFLFQTLKKILIYLGFACHYQHIK